MSYSPLQINFGVDVDPVYGGVSGPCSDGVDIDARAKQVCSSRVPDGVRAHKRTEQRWMGSGSFADMLAKHPVDAVASEGFTEPVEKY